MRNCSPQAVPLSLFVETNLFTFGSWSLRNWLPNKRDSDYELWMLMEQVSWCFKTRSGLNFGDS